MTLAIATPLFFYGKRDFDTPVYSHTYIHCDLALQYDVRSSGACGLHDVASFSAVTSLRIHPSRANNAS